MRCSDIRSDLVAFHFGDVTGEMRGELERHLEQCGDCLSSFLRLKRSIETGQEDPGPSEVATARLRRAMLAELRAQRSRREWSWWERPVALGFAGCALVGAVFTTQALTSGPGAPPRFPPATAPSP
jgi:anti-sigma factor RsiW